MTFKGLGGESESYCASDCRDYFFRLAFFLVATGLAAAFFFETLLAAGLGADFLAAFFGDFLVAFLTAFLEAVITWVAVFFVEAVSVFTVLDWAISFDFAPAMPPTTAPTAAPRGPIREPVAAPAAAPPAIFRPAIEPDFADVFFAFAIRFSLQ